ncbi:unnamed protein product, partial [Rotaria sordida]
RLGIPGPPPRFFFGNFLDIIKTTRLSLKIQEWTKQYGEIFGYFEGHTPILVISDPDILQDIFIKSFSNFHSRREFAFDEPYAKNAHLFITKGLRWKRQRSIMNPTFSSLKLKQMSTLMNRCVDTLMKKMAEQQRLDQPFDIFPFFKRFTMDIIWSCGFSLDRDMQNNSNDPYFVQSQRLFDVQNSTAKLMICSIFFTEFKWIWNKLFRCDNAIRYWLRHYLPVTRKFINDEPATWIENQAEQLIKKRLELGNTNRMDLLQLMLKSASDDNFIEDQPARDATTVDMNSESPLVRKLTKHEIASNILLFMVAGYETTSTALAYIFYVLATHPKEQQKLQDHVDAYFNSDIEPSYEVIAGMDYLDSFIREILRMHPITPSLVNRQSTQEFYIDKIGTVPIGTIISANTYSLHYNPDLWGPVDPCIFYPERFSTKRHPLAWIPFGAGPRNCVAMRFALMEIKMAVIRICKIYSIIDCGKQTHQSMDDIVEFPAITPRKLIIRLQRRD